MKTLAEFQGFYNEKLFPRLKTLEEARLKVVSNVYSYCGIAILISLGLVFLTRNLSNLPGMIIMLSFFALLAIYNTLTRSYVREFKNDIIEKIVEFIDFNLTYDNNGFLPVPVFIHSNIFQKHPDIYQGDDRVYGKIGVTNIDFSEVNAKYVTKDSKGRRHEHTIFKGLFFQADFNKAFKGKTYVLADFSERYLGSVGKFLQNINVSRPPIVRLEDPEFEKYFVVYGTDQIEARYILSTSLMKRIVDFKAKSKREIYLSFIDSFVYVAISYNRNLMEPKVFKTLLDFEPMKEYFEDLSLAIGIVEDLNLNTRIWSKE